MRVAHPVNLLDGVREQDRHLLQGRYRVYWTVQPGGAFKSFGVVDTIAMGRGLPLEDFVTLDAAQSDGRAHAVLVAQAANILAASADMLGLQVAANGLSA